MINGILNKKKLNKHMNLYLKKMDKPLKIIRKIYYNKNKKFQKI